MPHRSPGPPGSASPAPTRGPASSPAHCRSRVSTGSRTPSRAVEPQAYRPSRRIEKSYKKRVRRHKGAAIAVLARDIDRARHLGDLLDEIARRRGGVITGAAGD